ncbi:hypothetical protein KAR91_74360 [Candidatus Pacearchaeota archaeon]|nr:hypothetical protein [Candidatus Pacearchaeota archaeon]
MAFLVWALGICIFLAFLLSIFKPDVIRHFSRNDRIRKATSNARDNVRITNLVSNVVYRPDTRVPLGDGKSLYTLVSIHPPFHVLELPNFDETGFKQSPNTVFDSGISRMRIAIDDAGKAVESVAAQNIGVVHENPMLTPVETEIQLEATKKKLTNTEGKLREQEANERRNVEDIVEHVQNVTRSKTQPKPR